MAESILELENTGRDVMIFPIIRLEGKDKRPKVVRRIVIGDSADRVPYSPGERDHKLQPDPIVRLTLEDLADMTPGVRQALMFQIDSGTLRVLRGRELLQAA